MSLTTFLMKVKREPESILFSETLEIISTYYNYTPISFSNGDLINQIGSNEGSCKIFAFAQLNALTAAQTLVCFGEHYRYVLANPDGAEHQNIRNFMRFGFEGIQFDNGRLSLSAKLL